MKRWLANILTVASLAAFLFTAGVWLKHAHRKDFDFGGPIVFVGEWNRATPTFPRFFLFTDDGGYSYITHHPWPPERSPLGYWDDAPECVEWVAKHHERSRRFQRFGFHYSYWAMISSPGYPRETKLDMSEFKGYDTWITVPYWFVCAVTAMLPLAWCVRSVKRRRRRRTGACEDCGYDLRATPGRCPECGGERRRVGIAALQPADVPPAP